MHPLTTRTATCRTSGLLPALRELASLEPPGVVLECDGDPGPLEAVAACLRSAGAPVLGVVGPMPGGPPPAAGWPALDAADPEEQRRAFELLRATLPLLRAVRGARLLIPLDRARAGDLEALEARLGEAGAERTRALLEWRAAHASERARGAERLCRALHALARQEPSVELVLLPGPNPARLFDVEVAEWVLEDLRRERVGLALDTGALGLASARGDLPVSSWLERHGPSIRLVLLADHDGAGRMDLLPGAGSVDFQALRAEIPRETARILRPDPGAPLGLLREADRFLKDRLGARTG